jgi:hypothetical protein
LSLLTLGLSCARDSAPPQAAEDVSCIGCEVRYELAASIGSPNDPWSVRNRITARLLKRAAGDYLVFDVARPPVVHYSSRGEYLGVVGRAGSGPGEFRGPWAAAVDESDSLFVYDARLRTMATFSPSLQHVRTVGFSHVVVWFAPIRDGFIVHGHEPDTAKGRHRLHVVSKGGEYVAALDSASEYHGRSIGNSVASRIGHLSSAELHILTQVPPRLARYDTNAKRLLMANDLRPAWYPGPEVSTRRYVPDDPLLVPQDIPQRPARSVMALATDGTNRIWTLAWVEAPGWEETDPPFGEIPPRGAVQRHMERYWVARIDVYEPGMEQPLVSETLPLFGLTLLRGPELVTLRESADGIIVFDIYRLNVVASQQ